MRLPCLAVIISCFFFFFLITANAIHIPVRSSLDEFCSITTEHVDQYNSRVKDCVFAFPLSRMERRLHSERLVLIQPAAFRP